MITIRVMIVDDHALVRAGLRALIASLQGIEVWAEASDGRTALSALKQNQPDVVLLDISMPGLNGLEIVDRIVRDHPTVRVLMLSAHANEEYVWQALRAGAAGYLIKDSGLLELELAIRAVARGETYLSPAISRQVVSDYIRRVGGEESTLDVLTPRQRETLQLLAEGNSTKEAARIMHVSVKTVETHRSQLMERLGIFDLASLVRYAIRVGLVRSDT